MRSDHYHHNQRCDTLTPTRIPISTPSNGGGSPTAGASSGAHSSPGRSVTPQKDGPVHLTLVVPSLSKKLTVDLTSQSTLADLITAAIAKEASLLGCKVVAHGRVLSGESATKTLAALSIFNGETLYIASGTFGNPNHLLLYQIQEEYASVRHQVERATLTDQQKKALYEQLMRALFRTDDLTDLEDEWRAKRKQLVKDITALQDTLRTDHH